MREAPGYLDLQINGAFGYDFTTDPGSIWKVGERLVEHGVTAFLPTVISAAPGTVERALATLAEGPPPGYRGARALGMHAEGPMLASERRGTHPADRLVSASINVVSGWGPGLAVVTIAPELPGAREVIESLVKRGVRVSIGHTTATYDQALAAVDWGASMVTHLFNAMPPLEHRAPGPIGVALSDRRLKAGLIVDGIHAHPGTVAAAWESLGPDRLFLVSDAIAAAGMPAGEYSIGDVAVTVTEDRVLNQEGRLAGSILFLDQAVRNLVDFTACKPDEAIAAATIVPATAIGAEPIGAILLDDDLVVVRTTIDGKEVWGAMSLWDEIESQPKVLAAALERLSSPAQETADWIRSINPAVITIAARGSSDNAARYAQYVWGARNGINVGLATPSLFGAYEAPPRLHDSLVVGISQSGASPDLLNVLVEARSQGRPTLAITNEPESQMAEVADRTLDLGAGAETAVAVTKTYTSQLLAIALISAALDPDPTESLIPVPEQAAVILAAPAPSWIDGLSDHNRCLVIGRGFHHATAHEWSLKIAELAYLVAQPFSAADFRHGPMALIEPGLLTCLVSTNGPMAEQMTVLAQDIASKGGIVVAVTDDPALPSDQRVSIPAIAEWVAPITAIVAAQVFTYHLTRARGIDPDRPRSIQKVTKTL